MTDTKHTIHEKIDVLMYSHDSYGKPTTISIDHKQFIERLNDLYAKNLHRPFVSFCIELVKDNELGQGLLFSGEREEDKEETAKREAAEAAKHKALEDSELREYLRLKKIYGK